MTATISYLAADQVDGCLTFYGVPVFWSGEDGDACALTADVRLGLAAIHALGRIELGQPVASYPKDGYKTGHARFWIPDDGTDEWDTAVCDPADVGALPYVLALEVGPYNDRMVPALAGSSVTIYREGVE